METRKKLRKLLNEPGLIVAPGCTDCFSARLIENAGFPAVYLGSFAASSTLLGLPDIGLISRSEYLSLASRIVDSINIPLIADAEDGYGDVLAVRRTVKDYEQAGVAALHIEDHLYGKHIDMENGKLISIEEMSDKIKHAVDARTDEDLVIIGRSDSWVYDDVNIAIDRGCAMAEAGADLVLMSGRFTDDERKKLSENIPVPFMCLNIHTQGKSFKDYEKDNVKLLVCWYELQLAAKIAMEDFLKRFKEEENCQAFLPQTYLELDHLMGMDHWRAYMKLTKGK